MHNEDRLREEIRRIALVNAIIYNGKAQQGAVMGKLLAKFPNLRQEVKELLPKVGEIIEEVNRMSLPEQRRIVQEKWPQKITRSKVEKEKGLPPLPNTEKYETVITRFSPNPDAPIHLGSARAIILCHEYAKMYDGKFIVRFEDTDPKLKRPHLEFYDLIKEDLHWLACEPDEYYIQSERLPTYYEYAERLIREGHAYICTCKRETFKKYTSERTPCPCRNLHPSEHLSRWQMMLDGTYNEREAVVRVKTDLKHPNPAVRDWPAMRIIDTKAYPHPLVGSKYQVWPLYNLACGVDDHLMDITHIIRGKEHLTNQIRQEYMYQYLGWTYPETIHYGRMKIVGTSLSKSKIIQGMNSRIYKGWDDPRLATFAALRRRGIQAGAIHHLIIELGPKSQDVTISWENLYAHNRRLIEPKSNRYFFIHDPKEFLVTGVPNQFTVDVPLHPNYPERGHRHFEINTERGMTKLWIANNDLKQMKKRLVRLMELFNVQPKNEAKTSTAVYHSEEYEKAREAKAPLIHWLPRDSNISCQVVLPDASLAKGLVEESCREVEVDTIVQFERFGFVRIDRNRKDSITAYYCHR